MAGININRVTRLLLGLVFIGAGIFSLFGYSDTLLDITYNFYNLTNIVGITLIVFGIFIIIRAFTNN
jgi:uncharacterized membrane protein HdeD (DUF308 family)